MRGLMVFGFAMWLPLSAWAQAPGGGMHHGECDPNAAPKPLLSVADFDGDGTVTGKDVLRLWFKVVFHRYEAIMDRNADGDLDLKDLLLAKKDLGKSSTGFDHQLVAVWKATKRYRKIGNAVADGFRPFTQTLSGHGIHYARLPVLYRLDGTLDPGYVNHLDDQPVTTLPEGLNYDENGKLIAVFYYHGIDVKDWVLAADRTALTKKAMALSLAAPKPKIFASSHEMWHSHFGPCFEGLDYQAMTFDPTIVPYFTQPLTDKECAQLAAQKQSTSEPKLGWLPAFNMMHLWLFKLNPCGVFGGIHPHVATSFPEEPHEFPFADWYQKQFGTAPPAP